MAIDTSYAAPKSVSLLWHCCRRGWAFTAPPGADGQMTMTRHYDHLLPCARGSSSSSRRSSAGCGGGLPSSPRPVAVILSDYPSFSPLAFTADALIPLVNTHQTDFWAVSGSTQAGRGAILYSRLAAISGWFLTTAAALGFTGLIRRD